MIRSNINSATVFPRLKGILEEDIKVLKEMKTNSYDDADFPEFIHSLISAKNKILDLLPSIDVGISESPTPPQKLHIVGVEKTDSKDISNLFSALRKTEDGQMKFVQDAVVSDGMPDILLEKLKNILDIYVNITEQLGRSFKTKQFNPIVV